MAAPEGLPPAKLRVAGAQIPVVRDIALNVAAIERAIAFSAAEKADILLTSEGSLSGYVHDFDQAAVARALEQVVTKAREARLALALGVCFEEPEDHQRYDEIRFYNKDGAFVGFHAKILLCRKVSAPGTPGEVDYFRSKPLRTFHFNSIPDLTFGGLICNDLWANPEWTPQADPHLTQQLARMGARVIFQSVNSGLGDGDELLLNRQFHETNLRIRARSGRQWIVIADAADPAGQRANQCYSGVVDATGNWVVKSPPVGEQMFAQTIELADLASQGNDIKNSAPPSRDTVRFFVDPRSNSDDPDRRMAYGLNVTPPWPEGGSLFINLPEHLEYMPGTRGIARHHDKRRNVWQVSLDGSGAAYAVESLAESGVFFGLRVRAVEDRAFFEMSITNRSAKVLKSIRPLLCYQYHSLAGFPSANSDNFAHTYVMIDGKLVSVASLRVKDPRARARMAQVKDCADEHNWWAQEMGGMIEERLDRALTVLTDRSDDRKVVVLWEPGKNLLCNQEIPCLHADPCIGDLGPGEARTVRGQLVFTRAPLDQVVAELGPTASAAPPKDADAFASESKVNGPGLKPDTSPAMMTKDAGIASSRLPGRYFELLQAGVARVEQRLANDPTADLQTLESVPGWRHFPSAVLVAAVLYAKDHPANLRRGDAKLLALAHSVGDLLVNEHAKGLYTTRLDHHRDTYMWIEAYRLLEQKLGNERRERWRNTLTNLIATLANDAAEKQDYPWYQSPFISTSPNHYALWATTVYLGGTVLGNGQWEQLGARVMHRFATEEQASDGYWGEWTRSGPTTGYDYLTLTGVALYYEHSHDPTALDALRRSTDFHKYFTWPDGTPVETINDRNRYWGVSPWGHFGFSHFPDGRRYAEFLTSFFSPEVLDLESLGRLAQDALYFHAGPTAPIPQDLLHYAHQMSVPAGIRKTGPWVVCLSGLIATPTPSRWYLDRQGNLSVFHEKLGLIITGANSKNQPELATFTERDGERIVHTPTSSRLKMSDDVDQLALAYNSFFVVLEVPPAAGKRQEFRFVTTSTGRMAEVDLNLQLVLKPGAALETAAGRKALLDGRVIQWRAEDVGGWIRHRGWIMKLPPGARLTWPVYPFNPYRNGPETDLTHAVGTISVKLTGKQTLGFALEADE